MLEAHRQSKVTIDLLKAYSAAAYADLSEIHRAARRFGSGLGFEHATPQGDIAQPAEMFTSHEALLLNYEQALTRWDELTEAWWATSAHMIWIGERTSQLDGAHVEYAQRHRQYDRRQMRADDGARRSAAPDRAARSGQPAGAAGPDRPLRRRATRRAASPP